MAVVFGVDAPPSSALKSYVSTAPAGRTWAAPAKMFVVKSPNLSSSTVTLVRSTGPQFVTLI